MAFVLFESESPLRISASSGVLLHLLRRPGRRQAAGGMLGAALARVGLAGVALSPLPGRRVCSWLRVGAVGQPQPRLLAAAGAVLDFWRHGTIRVQGILNRSPIFFFSFFHRFRYMGCGRLKEQRPCDMHPSQHLKLKLRSEPGSRSVTRSATLPVACLHSSWRVMIGIHEFSKAFSVAVRASGRVLRTSTL